MKSSSNNCGRKLTSPPPPPRVKSPENAAKPLPRVGSRIGGIPLGPTRNPQVFGALKKQPSYSEFDTASNGSERSNPRQVSGQSGGGGGLHSRTVSGGSTMSSSSNARSTPNAHFKTTFPSEPPPEDIARENPNKNAFVHKSIPVIYRNTWQIIPNTHLYVWYALMILYTIVLALDTALALTVGFRNQYKESCDIRVTAFLFTFGFLALVTLFCLIGWYICFVVVILPHFKSTAKDLNVKVLAFSFVTGILVSLCCGACIFGLYASRFDDEVGRVKCGVPARTTLGISWGFLILTFLLVLGYFIHNKWLESVLKEKVEKAKQVVDQGYGMGSIKALCYNEPTQPPPTPPGNSKTGTKPYGETSRAKYEAQELQLRRASAAMVCEEGRSSQDRSSLDTTEHSINGVTTTRILGVPPQRSPASETERDVDVSTGEQEQGQPRQEDRPSLDTDIDEPSSDEDSGTKLPMPVVSSAVVPIGNGEFGNESSSGAGSPTYGEDSRLLLLAETSLVSKPGNQSLCEPPRTPIMPGRPQTPSTPAVGASPAKYTNVSVWEANASVNSFNASGANRSHSMAASSGSKEGHSPPLGPQEQSPVLPARTLNKATSSLLANVEYNRGGGGGSASVSPGGSVTPTLTGSFRGESAGPVAGEEHGEDVDTGAAAGGKRRKARVTSILANPESPTSIPLAPKEDRAATPTQQLF